MPFPLADIVNLISGAISAFIAFVLMRRHGLTNERDDGARRFTLFFSLFALMWLLFALAGLSGITGFPLHTIFFLADSMVYASSMVGVTLASYALGKPHIGRWIRLGILGLLIIFIINRLQQFEVYEHVVVGPYVYWLPLGPAWLSLMTGSVASFASIFFAAVFLVQGFRARHNPAVYWRSLFLGLGMLCVLISSVLFFIFVPPSANAVLASAGFSAGGLCLMYVGVARRQDD